jgi:hypothetical protein
MTLTTMMETNLDDVLTDEPVGKPMSELDPPLFDQLQEHIQFVETAGAQGLPADLSGVDLRPVKTMANMNLAAIRACNTTFYGLDLRNTELQGANLENADLRNSNLEGLICEVQTLRVHGWQGRFFATAIWGLRSSIRRADCQPS